MSTTLWQLDIRLDKSERILAYYDYAATLELIQGDEPFLHCTYTIPSTIACCHQAHLSLAISSVPATTPSAVIRTTAASSP